MEDVVLQISLTGELTDSLDAELIWTPLGARGVGIKRVDLTARNGLVDTYCITFDDGHAQYYYITNGARGERGPQGIAGPPGIQGPAGIQGIQGERGVAGPVGPEGPQGIQGPVGPQGRTGPAGHSSVGPAGPQGVQGPAGPSGPQGIQGPAGPAGPAGPQGERGFSGVAVETTGLVAFNITEDGILQCSYTGDEAPDYYIDENGHLILEV